LFVTVNVPTTLYHHTNRSVKASTMIAAPFWVHATTPENHAQILRDGRLKFAQSSNSQWDGVLADPLAPMGVWWSANYHRGGKIAQTAHPERYQDADIVPSIVVDSRGLLDRYFEWVAFRLEPPVLGSYLQVKYIIVAKNSPEYYWCRAKEAKNTVTKVPRDGDTYVKLVQSEWFAVDSGTRVSHDSGNSVRFNVLVSVLFAPPRGFDNSSDSLSILDMDYSYELAKINYPAANNSGLQTPAVDRSTPLLSDTALRRAGVDKDDDDIDCLRGFADRLSLAGSNNTPKEGNHRVSPFSNSICTPTASTAASNTPLLCLSPPHLQFDGTPSPGAGLDATNENICLT
jgi:hypothetical protein